MGVWVWMQLCVLVLCCWWFHFFKLYHTAPSKVSVYASPPLSCCRERHLDWPPQSQVKLLCIRLSSTITVVWHSSSSRMVSVLWCVWVSHNEPQSSTICSLKWKCNAPRNRLTEVKSYTNSVPLCTLPLRLLTEAVSMIKRLCMTCWSASTLTHSTFCGQLSCSHLTWLLFLHCWQWTALILLKVHLLPSKTLDLWRNLLLVVTSSLLRSYWALLNLVSLEWWPTTRAFLYRVSVCTSLACVLSIMAPVFEIQFTWIWMSGFTAAILHWCISSHLFCLWLLLANPHLILFGLCPVAVLWCSISVN